MCIPIPTCQIPLYVQTNALCESLNLQVDCNRSLPNSASGGYTPILPRPVLLSPPKEGGCHLERIGTSQSEGASP